MNILVTGTLGFDYIMNFSGTFADRIMPDKIHEISLSFLVDTLKKQFGGTAGNIAYSLKLLGYEPIICAPAGNDFAPYRQFFIDHGIDVSHIPIYDKESTSSYFVVTDKVHNQIGSFYSGATKYASKINLSNNITKETFVIISPTDPKAMNSYVKQCQDKKVRYLYDPAFQIGAFTVDDLKLSIEHAEILIGNDYEISLIENKLGISHEELILMVPVLITTLGAKGSIIETRNESIHIKSVPVAKVIDPTGAGDAYRSGFLAGYFKKFDLEICGQMGSLASWYVIQKSGTIAHAYSQNDFMKQFETHFGNKLKFS